MAVESAASPVRTSHCCQATWEKRCLHARRYVHIYGCMYVCSSIQDEEEYNLLRYSILLLAFKCPSVSQSVARRPVFFLLYILYMDGPNSPRKGQPTRLTLSQCWCLEIRQSAFPNYIKFIHRRILGFKIVKEPVGKLACYTGLCWQNVFNKNKNILFRKPGIKPISTTICSKANHATTMPSQKKMN